MSENETVNETASQKKMSASDFIRRHPDLSAKALIEEGAKQGLTFHANLVYNIRSKAGKPAKKASSKKPSSRIVEKARAKSRSNTVLLRDPVRTSAPEFKIFGSDGSDLHRHVVRLVLQHGIRGVRNTLDQIEKHITEG